MKPQVHHLLPALAGLSLAVGAATLQAASFSWGGGNLLWNNTSPEGWNGGPPVAGDDATIGSGTVTFAGSDTFGNAATGTSAAISVNSVGTLASGGKFNTIWNLSLGGGTLLSNGGATPQFPAFDLAGTVTAAGGVTSSIATGTGSYSLINLGNGTTAPTGTTFDVGAAGTLNVGTVLQNHWYYTTGPFMVAAELVKTGDGLLNLTAANTYTGGTTINRGILAFSGGGTTSTTGGFTVASSGTLRFDRHDTWGNHLTTATPVITIESGGTVISNNTYTTLINPVLDGGTINANGGVNASYPAFGLKGTVSVNGTASGSTIGTTGAGDFNQVSIGTGSAGGTTAFDVADGAAATDLTVSTPLSNLAGVAAGLTKTGDGTMSLASANLFTGVTTVSGGTLELAASGSGYSGTLKGDLAIENATVRVAQSNGIWGWDPTVLKNLTIHNGGVLTVAASAVATLGNITMAGGTLAAEGNGDTYWGSWGIKPPTGPTATVTVTADSSITAPRVTLNVNGGTTVFAVADGADLAVSSSLINGGVLAKSGAGTLTLTGTSAYTGQTTVNEGRLTLSGTGSIAASTTIEVAGGAFLDVSAVTGGWSLAATQTLRGAGTVAGDATLAGTLAPGSGVGTLSFTGSLGLAGVSDFEIDAALLGADRAAVAGQLAFGGSLNVTNADGTLAEGMSFDLFDFAGRADATEFASISLPDPGAGLAWDLSSLYTDGVITVVVPEPAPLAFAALAFLAAAARRRRHACR